MDLGRLGHVFGLLRMPRMAEIKHAAEALKNFRPSSVDPETVQVRVSLVRISSGNSNACNLLHNLAGDILAVMCCISNTQTIQFVRQGVVHAVSNPLDVCGLPPACRAIVTQFRENTREKQRQKALRQAAAAAPAQSAQPAGPKPGKGAGKRPQLEEARLPAAKRRLLDGRQDAAELADEYALLRKLKKGKLSEVRENIRFLEWYPPVNACLDQDAV